MLQAPERASFLSRLLIPSFIAVLVGPRWSRIGDSDLDFQEMVDGFGGKLLVLSADFIWNSCY